MNIPKKYKDFIITLIKYIIPSLLIWGVGYWLINNIWFPKTINKMNVNYGIIYYNSFPIPMGLITVLCFGLMFGWIIHGVGFKIIEVRK